MNNILIVTGIVPDKENKGGPSGLIWECIEVLKEKYSVDIYTIDSNTYLKKLGIIKINNNIDYDNYKYILIYPFNLAFSINKKYRNKSIVLGPDSPSLLFSRFFRDGSTTLMSKVRNFILAKWFLYQEKRVLKIFKIFLVVGKNDMRWILKHQNKEKIENIKYLTHPILSSVIESASISNSTQYNNKAIVFAGDMSPKYTGNLIYEILPYLNNIIEKNKISILIVGKNNKWIYDLYYSSNIKNIDYSKWIENYHDICNPNFHIHIIPLRCGAGTKNRTLTACAVGVPIISTSIGLENVLYSKPSNIIHKANNAIEFIEAIEHVLELDNLKINQMLIDGFIERVNNKFKKELIENFNID